MRWWHKEKVDTILTKPPPSLHVYYQARGRHLLGFDHEGRVFCFERLGEFIGNYSYRALPLADWIRCYTYDMLTVYQQLRESSQKHKRVIETVTYVADLKGLGFLSGKASMSLLREFTKVVEVNFPELAGPIVLYNAPRSVTRVCAIAKRFLDPVVAGK